MKKRAIITWISALSFLGAVGIMLYPAVSNYVNQRFASEIRTEYMQQMADSDDARLRHIRELAETYNKALIPGATEGYTRENLLAAAEDYEQLLNPVGNGTMGYLEIPKIQAQLPILHGTDSATLEQGIGHLLGSSLPVGGDSTHAVLTGHSGMASRKLFTDLSLLEVGDVFYLQILNETLAYQVDQIQTVLPHDTTYLQILPGEDHCTLVTCMPIGVNTHRLLVRGSRIAYAETVAQEELEVLAQTAGSNWEEQYYLGLLLGLLFIAAAIAVCFLIQKWKNKKRGRFLCEKRG